ncbi:MAG: amino acid-binding ACT domain protein [Candidatus Micrarchaeota archaeon]|nr:amino acid-binding ACT domain protein [Candidatus Micrarchaeota archaeon]
MLGVLEEHFAGQRAKLKVINCMLRLGLSVDKEGRIFCERIQMAPAKIAKALGIDRRVVIQTAKEIASDEKLLTVFSHLSPIANVSMAAKFLGHDCFEINADPHSVGVVAQVSTILANNNVSIRQIITDDPDLYPDPKMTVVVEGKLPQKAIAQLRKLGIQSIVLK